MTTQESKLIKKRWSESDFEYLLENIGKTSMIDICKHLDRNENSIHLKLHRERANPKCVVVDNVLFRMIKKVFLNPLNFTPSRDFYNKVKIGQKRFWSIYRGEIKIDNDECQRVSRYLGLNYAEWVDCLQRKFEFEESVEWACNNDVKQ